MCTDSDLGQTPALSPIPCGSCLHHPAPPIRTLFIHSATPGVGVGDQLPKPAPPPASVLGLHTPSLPGPRHKCEPPSMQHGQSCALSPREPVCAKQSSRPSVKPCCSPTNPRPSSLSPPWPVTFHIPPEPLVLTICHLPQVTVPCPMSSWGLFFCLEGPFSLPAM